MSSIISDIFYGSKQAILDNYLIQQHNQPSLESQQQAQDHTTTVTPFIQFHISAPQANQLSAQQLLVTVEMGRHTDSAWLEVEGKKSFEVPTVGLVLGEVGRDELKKYTNIRLTLSQGKHKAKVSGFIPIETLKNIASIYPHEKTCIVQLRGRQSIGITEVQCMIRVHNDKILNSDILGSVDYLYQQSRDLSRATTPLGRPSREKIMIEDESRGMVDMIREVGEVELVVVKIELLDARGEKSEISLRWEQNYFEIGDILKVTKITMRGVTIWVNHMGKTIGSIFLNPLFLTMNKAGELPVYSQEKTCLGTALIKHPSSNIQSHPSTFPNTIKTFQQTVQAHPKKQQQIQMECLFYLQIQKFILLLKTSGQQSEDEENVRRLIDDRNHMEVVIRYGSQIFKFDKVVLHHSGPNQDLNVIEVRRSGGFVINYAQTSSESNLIEVELISSMRLVTYGKYSLSSTFSHCFIPASSGSSFLHSAIYFTSIRLAHKTDQLQHNKTAIFDILSHISDKSLTLHPSTITSQTTIKTIINNHPSITFMQCQQLLSILQPLKEQIHTFQEAVVEKVKIEGSQRETWKKITRKIFEECLYLDTEGSQIILDSHFLSIMKFYWNDLVAVLGKSEAQAIIDHPIRKSQGQIIYPFTVAGYYLRLSNHHQDTFNQYATSKLEKDQKHPQDKQGRKESLPIQQTPIISIEPTYFIESITINKAHFLNNGKAPNTCLSLSKRICYSNNSPHFPLAKEVTLEPIHIYHKDISKDTLVLLAEFKPSGRKTVYELEPTGQCTAKILWGH